jgi:hypothetical protein
MAKDYKIDSHGGPLNSKAFPVLNKHKMEGTAGTTGTVSPVRSSCRNSAEDEGMLPGNRAGDWGICRTWQKR